MESNVGEERSTEWQDATIGSLGNGVAGHDVKLGDWCFSCGVDNYASYSSRFKWRLIRVEDDVASVVA
ncbi:hypothetical protein C4D60_Mb07t08740 [Musa balbisiana]|uniref:Uncharacterized protein n=1 Tax=Musa balbisiana TaxID=52838 RepID=A0A4S8JDY4_MUSBA|nr:hypothetical protein C4D60_Mb07t08740 [Musa balbisiana]